MTISRATATQTAEILKHALTVLKEATLGYVKPSLEKAYHMVSPSLSDGGYYLVHTEKSVIQGWIGVGHSYDFYTDEMVGVITELYVLPAYRSQRIAEKLCKEALKQLKDSGYKNVQLNVFNGNGAKHLYEKLGFSDVSTLMEIEL